MYLTLVNTAAYISSAKLHLVTSRNDTVSTAEVIKSIAYETDL